MWVSTHHKTKLVIPTEAQRSGGICISRSSHKTGCPIVDAKRRGGLLPGHNHGCPILDAKRQGWESTNPLTTSAPYGCVGNCVVSHPPPSAFTSCTLDENCLVVMSAAVR
jgi:hypothetical protein